MGFLFVEATLADEIQVETPEEELKSAEAAFAATDAAPAKAEAEIVEKVEAEPVKEAEPDPWEGVPAVVRTTLQGITSQLGGITALQNEVKAGTGRIAAIQRDLAARAKQTGDPAPTKQAIVAAFESPELLKKLSGEWPDVGEAIADALTRERAETARLVKAELQGQAPVDVAGIRSEFGKTVAESHNEAVQSARQLARVDLKYPEWEEHVFAPDRSHTPEFAAWKSTQPADMQALISSERASDAIKMLDAFYDHRKAQARKEANKERLEAAIPARGTQGQRQPTTNDRADAEKAFASA